MSSGTLAAPIWADIIARIWSRTSDTVWSPFVRAISSSAALWGSGAIVPGGLVLGGPALEGFVSRLMAASRRIRVTVGRLVMLISSLLLSVDALEYMPQPESGAGGPAPGTPRLFFPAESRHWRLTAGAKGRICLTTALTVMRGKGDGP